MAELYSDFRRKKHLLRATRGLNIQILLDMIDFILGCQKNQKQAVEYLIHLLTIEERARLFFFLPGLTLIHLLDLTTILRTTIKNYVKLATVSNLVTWKKRLFVR